MNYLTGHWLGSGASSGATRALKPDPDLKLGTSAQHRPTFPRSCCSMGTWPRRPGRTCESELKSDEQDVSTRETSRDVPGGSWTPGKATKPAAAIAVYFASKRLQRFEMLGCHSSG